MQGGGVGEDQGFGCETSAENDLLGQQAEPPIIRFGLGGAQQESGVGGMHEVLVIVEVFGLDHMEIAVVENAGEVGSGVGFGGKGGVEDEVDAGLGGFGGESRQTGTHRRANQRQQPAASLCACQSHRGQTARARFN